MGVGEKQQYQRSKYQDPSTIASTVADTSENIKSSYDRNKEYSADPTYGGAATIDQTALDPNLATTSDYNTDYSAYGDYDQQQYDASAYDTNYDQQYDPNQQQYTADQYDTTGQNVYEGYETGATDYDQSGAAYQYDLPTSTAQIPPQAPVESIPTGIPATAAAPPPTKIEPSKSVAPPQPQPQPPASATTAGATTAPSSSAVGGGVTTLPTGRTTTEGRTQPRTGGGPMGSAGTGAISGGKSILPQQSAAPTAKK